MLGLDQRYRDDARWRWPIRDMLRLPIYRNTQAISVGRLMFANDGHYRLADDALVVQSHRLHELRMHRKEGGSTMGKVRRLISRAPLTSAVLYPLGLAVRPRFLLTL